MVAGLNYTTQPLQAEKELIQKEAALWKFEFFF